MDKHALGLRHIELSSGQGQQAVLALATLSPRSLLVQIYAGSAHLGSVVWAFPRQSLNGEGPSCTSSVINAVGHKDEAVARPLAEKLCVATGLPCAVAAGLHLDNASAADIETLCQNTEALFPLIMAEISYGYSPLS